MEKNHTNVLIFGGGLQTLSLARGLKQVGYNVFVAADADSVSRFSRYIDSFHGISLKDFTAKRLISFIRQNNIEVVIPTEDDYAEWLSYRKQQIEDNTKSRLAVENIDTFRKVIDKHILLEICSRHGIPHPKTAPIFNTDQLRELAPDFQFPVLIKPNISDGSRGIRKVTSHDGLEAAYRDTVANYGDCSIQEFIDNPSHYYNVMLYRTEDGRFLDHAVTKITRFYPVHGGSSSFCTTIENEDILRPCRRLLEILDWKGFADFDVLEKSPGDYRIIEINPRVPASVEAAAISGINFGEIIVNDLLGIPLPQYTYTPGQQLRCLGLDIAWFIFSPDRFKCSPSWFKFFSKRMAYQEGGSKDLKAMCYSIWSGIRKQLSPSFRKSKAGMN